MREMDLMERVIAFLIDTVLSDPRWKAADASGFVWLAGCNSCADDRGHRAS
jgi:hypothetical protein